MKRSFLAFMLVLSITSICYAQVKEASGRAAYADAVIAALGYCDQAMSTEYGEDEPPESIRAKLSAQNSTLERAKAELSLYLTSDDILRKIGSDIITKRINGQISLNNKQLEVYDKYKDKISEDSFTEAEWEDMVGQFESVDTANWRSVVEMAEFAALDTIVMPKEGTPTGKISLRISKAEKNQLVKELDRLFGSKIQGIIKGENTKDYDADEAQDNILMSAFRMYNVLSSTTFEERKRKNAVWVMTASPTSK